MDPIDSFRTTVTFSILMATVFCMIQYTWDNIAIKTATVAKEETDLSDHVRMTDDKDNENKDASKVTKLAAVWKVTVNALIEQKRVANQAMSEEAMHMYS